MSLSRPFSAFFIRLMSRFVLIASTAFAIIYTSIFIFRSLISTKCDEQADLIANCDNTVKELLEDLPVTLTYEIARSPAVLISSQIVRTYLRTQRLPNRQIAQQIAGRASGLVRHYNSQVANRLPFSRYKRLTNGFQSDSLKNIGSIHAF